MLPPPCPCPCSPRPQALGHDQLPWPGRGRRGLAPVLDRRAALRFPNGENDLSAFFVSLSRCSFAFTLGFLQNQYDPNIPACLNLFIHPRLGTATGNAPGSPNSAPRATDRTTSADGARQGRGLSAGGAYFTKNGRW